MPQVARRPSGVGLDTRCKSRGALVCDTVEMREAASQVVSCILCNVHLGQDQKTVARQRLHFANTRKIVNGMRVTHTWLRPHVEGGSTKIGEEAFDMSNKHGYANCVGHN